MTAYDQIKTAVLASSDGHIDTSLESAVAVLKRDLAEIPLPFYGNCALSYAIQLLCHSLESRPWWLAQMEGQANSPVLLTVAPENLRGNEFHLERCLGDAWQRIFGTLSMVPERWKRFTCISLHGQASTADIASFPANDIPDDENKPDFAYTINSREVSLDDLAIPNEGNTPQAAFCIIPKDAELYALAIESILPPPIENLSEALTALSSPEWRIAVQALSLVRGKPTVAMMPTKFLDSQAGEQDRTLLAQKGLITQVLELPLQDCPEETPLALVRLGEQEAYGTSRSLGLGKSQTQHLEQKDIRFIDADMEALRCGQSRATGENFLSLLCNGAFTRWADTFDMQVFGYSFLPSDYSVRTHDIDSTLVKMGDIARFKRGLPNKASAGKASFEAFYRECPWEGADAETNKPGSNNTIECRHISFATVGNGEIIDATRATPDRFEACRRIGIASPAAKKKLNHHVRMNALYRVDDDNSVIAIARSKNSFKVFLVENSYGAEPVYISVSASVLAAALKRDPQTSRWNVDPHYLLAYLTSPAGQERLKGAVRGGVVAQLSVGAMSDIEIPVSPGEAQRAIGDFYATEAERLTEAEQEAQRARDGITSICDALFAGAQIADANN